MSDESSSTPPETHEGSRRDTMSLLTNAGMFVGLAAAYGTLAAFMGRFVYPAKPPAKGWMFVTQAEKLGVGESILYRTPSGATVNIARQGSGSDVANYVALSSTCPHLGCQVHWEPQNNRFFCPCHNGIFDPSGKATGGPPGEAGQSLPTYPLRIADRLLYIEVPVEEVAMGQGQIIESGCGVSGPGHDPCLAAVFAERRT